MPHSSHKLQLFDELAAEVRGCTLCSEHLPQGPHPILQGSEDARILVAGQAPGRRVHDTGVPFNDPSGVRLRDWLGLDEGEFYDPRKLALLPMGFCYPGTGKSGDLPPRPECAATWRDPLLAAMPSIRLRILVGSYAIRWHLPEARGNVTAIVSQWRDHAPGLFLAPHPSPRNNRWLRERPWFEGEVVPALRDAVQQALA